jgi:hypothetical protein
MKNRTIGILTCGVIAGGFIHSGVAFAQLAPRVQINSEGAPTNDLPMADLQAFDEFSAAHPEIVRELSHNPRLLSNESFIRKNPPLRDFLASHTELRAKLIENPGDFLPLAHGAKHHKAAPAAGGKSGNSAKSDHSGASAPIATPSGAPVAGSSSGN